MRTAFTYCISCTVSWVVTLSACSDSQPEPGGALRPGTSTSTLLPSASGATSSAATPALSASNTGSATSVAPSSSATTPGTGASARPSSSVVANGGAGGIPASSASATESTPLNAGGAGSVEPDPDAGAAGGTDSAPDDTTAAGASGASDLDSGAQLPGAGGSAGSGSSDIDAGGEPSGGCPGAGNVQYTLNGEESWPPEVVDLLTAAMDEGVAYYNCYSDLSHSLTVNYNSSVPTAEANVDGWMSFGTNRAYMVVATVMHEIGHTMGVGYSPWTELTDADRRWTGAAVNALLAALPESEKDPDSADFITADTLHFWPYGLNYASEHLSEWSLINHVRIVAAMNEDKRSFLGN